jgi:multidrug resistance efflux pump
MLELLICSLFTVLPDYLVRRFVQGRRFGREITLFSVWYELRWGITGCLILTVLLLTVVFYYHPSSLTAVTYFRTVPILPETGGRVAEVNAGYREKVKAGQQLFRLDDASQRAAVETARRRVAEVDAAIVAAQADRAAADGRVTEAESGLRQARDELATKEELRARNPSTVPEREIERLRNVVAAREGSLAAARASREAVEAQIVMLLPAQRASAEAQLAQAEAELRKTVIVAGVDGTLEQFALRVGDVVNPMLRPAGVLVPSDAGRGSIFAGFGQIEAQVMRPGMVAEAACLSLPFTIIPLVVVEKQDVIASGQFRASDMLLDPLQSSRPGTVLVMLEPLYAGGLDRVPPGSFCIVNAYTGNHDRIADPATGSAEALWLHAVDAVGVVHAMILRLQALLLPIRTLVLGGH